MAKKAVAQDTTKPETMGEDTKVPVTIAKKAHQEAYEKVLARYMQKLTLPGFRQGKAPRKLVEDTVGEQRLIQDVLELVFPDAYNEAISKSGVKPLVHPHIDAEKALSREADWEIIAHTAIAPVITLGDWKKVIKEAAKNIPKPDHEHEEGHDHDHSGEEISFVLSKLIESVKPKIAPLLLEHETKRQLENFARELAQYKIDLDTYLLKTQKTIEAIQQEMMTTALGTLQVEFTLEAVTEELKPEVSEAEIKELIGKSYDTMTADSKAKIHHEAESIIKRRKTVDEIKNIAGIQTPKPSK